MITSLQELLPKKGDGCFPALALFRDFTVKDLNITWNCWALIHNNYYFTEEGRNTCRCCTNLHFSHSFTLVYLINQLETMCVCVCCSLDIFWWQLWCCCSCVGVGEGLGELQQYGTATFVFHMHGSLAGLSKTVGQEGHGDGKVDESRGCDWWRQTKHLLEATRSLCKIFVCFVSCFIPTLSMFLSIHVVFLGWWDTGIVGQMTSYRKCRKIPRANTAFLAYAVLARLLLSFE